MVCLRAPLPPPSEVYITYIPPELEVETLEQEIRAICKFDAAQVFTVKWIDEEGEARSCSVFAYGVGLVNLI